MIETVLGNVIGNLYFIFSVIAAFALAIVGAATKEAFRDTSWKNGIIILVAAILLAAVQPATTEIHAVFGVVVTIASGLSLGFGLFELAWSPFSKGGEIVEKNIG